MIELQAPRRGHLRLRQQPARPRPVRPGSRTPSTSRASYPSTSGPCSARGKGPFRWVALSGDPGRHRRDRPHRPRDLFPEKQALARWIRLAAERVALPGPAGAHLLAGVRGARPRRPGLQRGRGARAEISAPIVDRPRSPRLRLGRLPEPRDRGHARRHRRGRGLAAPELHAQRRQRSQPGSRFHHGGGVGIGYSLHAGQVTVADGTPEAAASIERVLTNDPGTGVMRHADAGYEEALRCARERGIDLPMESGDPDV